MQTSIHAARTARLPCWWDGPGWGAQKKHVHGAHHGKDKGTSHVFPIFFHHHYRSFFDGTIPTIIPSFARCYTSQILVAMQLFAMQLFTMQYTRGEHHMRKRNTVKTTMEIVSVVYFSFFLHCYCIFVLCMLLVALKGGWGVLLYNYSSSSYSCVIRV